MPVTTRIHAKICRRPYYSRQTPSDEVLKRRIQNYYLTNEGYPELDFFKLLPTQGDRASYSPIVQGAAGSLPDSQFKKAYEFFRRRLRDEIDEGVGIEVGKVLQILESRLMVVMINLSDGDDPYLIFESLNFKGSPLEQSDLVRNYFLMRFSINEQQLAYESLWLPMQNRLGPSLTEFMRHFLGAEGEEVRKGDVYASIKRLVADSDAPSVKLLMGRMERLSVLYSRIASSQLEPNSGFKSYFEQFQRLDFGTVYPLLLSFYEDFEDGQFSEEEFLNVLSILFSFITRRMVVGVPSNSLAGLFVGLCKVKPVTETPSAWLSQALISGEKNRRWPGDAEFAESWTRRPLYGSRACPVILEAIEAQYDHHEPVQLDQTTVEHIMPQTLSPEWEAMLGADARSTHEIWLHTIGNLTLTGYNPELGNKSYIEKRGVYALSHFDLNRYFAEVESWGQPMIADRATALFKFALHLWPRPKDPSAEAAEEFKKPPAAFHAACARVAQERLGVQFTKLSQTKYESGTDHIRMVCAVSGVHGEGNENPYYWFAFHRAQLEFLTASKKPFVCLGCGAATTTLLMPLSLLLPHLSSISITEQDDRYYWHIVIQKRADRLMLRLLGGVDGPDLTDYCAAVVPAEV